MTTKKLKNWTVEISKNFYETKWSKQSVTVYNQARKNRNQQTQLRVIIS